MVNDYLQIKKMVSPPHLKEFDLEIGDHVKYVAQVDKRNNIRHSLKEDPTYNRWTVTGISTRVFTAVNKYGVNTAFRKDEYRIGEVVKVD